MQVTYMITVDNVSLSFGSQLLFEGVNCQFTPGNCYGLIGANGAGKSTFLKIMSGDIEPSSGGINIPGGLRMAILKQDHFEFDEFTVLNTVLYGHKRLYDIVIEKDAIYAKEDFSDEDGIRAGELEGEFADLNGWDAESNAANMLSGIGIPESLHNTPMVDIEAKMKVRILLCQALFGDPDILLLDEPTNNLDVLSIKWLEEFLANFDNTVIVVSHDRHFLNAVCTHTADIDFKKIQMYTGNYEFWYQSSQLALGQIKDRNKKMEDKKKELEEFVRRFSANAAKSKQASSRKKMIEKLNIEEIKPSSRKYPHIVFNTEKEAGKDILNVENLSYSENGEVLFKDLTFSVNKGDKISFTSKSKLAISRLLQILDGEIEPTGGEYRWGITTTPILFPHDNTKFFQSDLNLVDWIRQYSTDDDESYVRGFLGQMLFSGHESQKQCNVLSGGEKVRCMLSRMMIQQGNVLLFDEPTDHLDLESITALNNSLINYKGTLLITSRDREFIETISTRIIELGPKGMIDSYLNYGEYLVDAEIQKKQAVLYR